jgi:ligand-binding sensor domain-containing protein
LTNYSQDLRFTHITTKDGLPNSLVFEIAQDKKGFIWFASNKGLVRYDGYNFRIFLPNNQRPQSISDKSVHKLLFDYDETLWISIQGRGLNKMDVETETFKYYFPDPNNPKSLSGNEVRQIYQHSDSTIWVATNKGLDYYDKANDCFVNILSQLKITANTVPNNYVNKIVFDNDNNIWILTKRGLGLYNKKRKIIESLGTISGKKWIDTLTINDIQLTKDNNKLWFATSHNGLFCYDIVSATVKNYLTNCGNISYLYLSSKGQLFVYVDKTSVALYVLPKSGFLTDSVKKFNLNKQLISITQLRFVEAKNGEIFIGGIMGLIKYDPEKGITYLESNNNVPSSIMSSNVEFIYIDNAQNLWVSLFRKGVDRANLQQKDFKWYVNDPQNNKSIAGNIISSIYEDSKKNIWVGCFENGVSIINKKNNSTHTIPIKPNDPSKINFNAPATMIEDKDGYIWIGYYDGQLDKVDPRSYKITHYHQNYPVGNPKRLDAWNLRKLLIDKFNNLWIASSMGIVELERKTNQFIYHSLLYEDNYMQNYLYRTMYIGNDGIIWAGSQNGGLIRYDTTAKKFNHFLYDPKDTNSISSNMVYAIVEENEKLWLGTSQGLNVFNKKTNLFERIAISDGMNDYSIYSILPDKLNNFWMSTDNGIIKFNKTSRNFVVFYESDGLPSNEYSTTAHCLSSTGEIYFGTYLGMVSFNPQELPVTQYKAHPKITDFKIFNRSIAPGDSFNNRTILTKQICSTKEIILSYKENDFILEFSALNYAAPEKIKYSYILEGYSDQWIHTTAQRRWAVFTGLPYGNYKFRLKATNNDGIECDENDQVVLSITITPPFWKALWFRVLLLIILAFIILMYFRWRINMVNIQKLQLEKSVRERTKELEEANVMLEENQEEINLQKEEILSQRDAMEEKNRLLTNQHKQITKQNQELDVHRNQLET